MLALILHDMEDGVVGYSDEYIAQLLSGPSLFSEGPSRIHNPRQDLIEKIEYLKKKHVRTELHARMLTQYLKSGIIPLGLQIRNVPGIFREDKRFRSGFSNLATTCSRHWMVLGVETALEHAKQELKDIEALEKELLETDAITDARTALDKLNKSIQEFSAFELKKKVDKVKKDIQFFTKEKAYPYLQEDYYTQNPFGNSGQTWGRYRNNRFVNFSESSGSSEGGDQPDGPSTSTAVPQQGPQQPPFLGRGQRGRGPRSRPWQQAGDRQTRRRYYRWGPEYP